MARRQKTGLEYYPMDVDIFDDDKLFYIRSKVGPLGELVIVKLFCAIYKEGYTYQWNDQKAVVFSGRTGIDVEVCKATVEAAFECDLLRRKLHSDYGLLSSKRIQEQYLKICKDGKRKEPEGGFIDRCFDLISKTPEEIPPLAELTPEEIHIGDDLLRSHSGVCTQSKVKESKGKESKLKDRSDRKSALQKTFDSRTGVWLEPSATDALEKWIRHRDEIKKPLTSSMLEAIFENYTLDIPRFIAAVKFTRTKGWQGLVDPSTSNYGNGPPNQGPKTNFDRNLEILGFKQHDT